VGTDPKTDLALLKVEGGNDFPFVKLAPQKARVGDWVLAIGNPFGLGGTVTAGIVSAQHRDIGAGPYDDFIQIDAPVNRGNSGGPTFNLAGEVVGVNTAIYSPSAAMWASPSRSRRHGRSDRRVAQENGSVTRGFIGVQMQPVTKEIAEAIGLKEPRGALVASAVADGPAAKAGIRTGDTIVAVDGETIKEARDLSRRSRTWPRQAGVGHGLSRRQGADRLPRGRPPAQGVAQTGSRLRAGSSTVGCRAASSPRCRPASRPPAGWPSPSIGRSAAGFRAAVRRGRAPRSRAARPRILAPAACSSLIRARNCARIAPCAFSSSRTTARRRPISPRPSGSGPCGGPRRQWARRLCMAESGDYDVLVVDRMLPKLDGLSLIRSLREQKVETPVLILSALGQVDDRVKGLRAGGDDYLPKPTPSRAPRPRGGARAPPQRRRPLGEPTSYRVGDLELDRLSHRVMRSGHEIVLQPREFRLLEYLMKNAGQVVTRPCCSSMYGTTTSIRRRT
jgi:CheY-like chemotaxis protein